MTTRARLELAIALVGAAGLAGFLVTHPGVRELRDEARALKPVASAIAGNTASTLPPAVENTTLISGPLTGTIHEAPAPELPPAVLARDREYIAEAFPALSSWSVAEVKPLLAPAALEASSDEQLAQVMTTLSDRLGTLQYFEAPQPVATAVDAGYTTASENLQPYRFTAYYEAGAAEVNLVLEKQQQHSALYSFDINIPN